MKKALLRFTAAAVLAGIASMATAQDSNKVLRMMPQTDLKVLDPIWTTAFVTRTHGYMIYDTLFGVDANGKVHPQMVDTYDMDADGMRCRQPRRQLPDDPQAGRQRNASAALHGRISRRSVPNAAKGFRNMRHSAIAAKSGCAMPARREQDEESSGL